jgi:hypothetical protein
VEVIGLLLAYLAAKAIGWAVRTIARKPRPKAPTSSIRTCPECGARHLGTGTHTHRAGGGL